MNRSSFRRTCIFAIVASGAMNHDDTRNLFDCFLRIDTSIRLLCIILACNNYNTVGNGGMIAKQVIIAPLLLVLLIYGVVV